MIWILFFYLKSYRYIWNCICLCLCKPQIYILMLVIKIKYDLNIKFLSKILAEMV